jgi:hypothetical protein
MFLQIQHTQWLVLGFFGGTILMLAIVLTYTAGWRERAKEREGERPLDSFDDWLIWVRAVFPWILVITLFAILIWSFGYPLFYTDSPPNW